MNDIYTRIDSPVGPLLLAGDGDSLSVLAFAHGRRSVDSAAMSGRRAEDAYASVREQLDEYFAGERRSFDVPLALRGSEFELRVWAALQEIPYGTTVSYGEIARRLGQPTASRAVGLANGRNPVALIVPCHRVIGANGSLTGYGGGLPRKRFLLDLEAGRLPLLAASAS